VTLGAMGLVGASLDVGSAMVAAVVIGIAVDDAIHLLAQYGRRRAEGATRPDAMHEAVLHVGRAVATTSIALALGFAALTLSSWKTISGFGGLAAIAILCALVAVLVVLPALVAIFRGRSGAFSPHAGS
jgi:predicted RND superfamily exporter protein